MLLVARSMAPLSLLKASDQRELRIIDIEIPTSLPAELREPPRLPDDPGPPPKAEAERVPDARLARGAAPSPAAPGLPTAETSNPEVTPPPATAGTQKPSQFDELPPDDRGGVLGVPGVPGLGRPVYTMPGVLPAEVHASAPASTVAPAPRPVDKDIAGKVMRDLMASKDKEIGLDLPVAGSIRSVLRETLQNTDIPAGAKGSVTCMISPAGVVSNCRLQSSTAGRADSWAIATRAAAAVAGTALPGQYAHGAMVTVDISIVNSPPAGSKGGWSGAGANFDVSNIGAHQTRQVKTSHHVVALP
jgi:hypothetical protein